MCNCNSSFCAVCCRRVKAYRFDNVPEITGDLQLYTEFYKVGEAYGHWKFTVDDLEAYLDIPTVLWADQEIAFGQTGVGGLNHHGGFLFHYPQIAFSMGVRAAGTIGTGTTSLGGQNVVSGFFGTVFGYQNNNSANYATVSGYNNTLLANFSFISGNSNVQSDGVGIGTFITGSHNTHSNALYAFVSGYLNNVSGSGHYSFTHGTELANSGVYSFLIGAFGNVTHTGNAMLLDGSASTMSSSTANQFTGRFANGYRFMLDASTIAVDINSSGQIVANFVPSSPSSTDIIVRGAGNILSSRTVASLPFTNNTGTVTNVELALPNSTFSISGSPINTTGTLTGTFISQTAKHVLAAPWGFNGTPIWRQLQTSDLQQNGATLGQVVTWDGTAWTAQNLPVTGVPTSRQITINNDTYDLSANRDLGDYVSLNWPNAIHNSSLAGNANSYTQNLEVYTNGMTNTPVGVGYGHFKAQGFSSSYALQTWASGAGGDAYYFRILNTTWGSWYHIASRDWVSTNYVPTSRTITINGVTLDLSANRTWTISTASPVWNIQGGTTPATSATSQDIYHIGKMKIGFSTTSSISAYDLNVTGNNGIASNRNLEFQSLLYGVSGVDSGVTIRNMIRQIAGSLIEIGNNVNDIYLPGYTSSRSVDTKTLLDKTLFVNSSGVVKSESSEWVRNDGASCWITSTESHLADNTNRRVTFDVSASTSNTYYTFSYSSGDYKMFFPGSYSQHLVICTLEYTTSGTPTVTATLRRTSTVIETNISTSADGRKVMTIHAIMSGTSSDYPTLYIYNATGGASITLQKCKITMIPLGETPP